MLDIIVRFRTYRIALAADVEKAFLMVSISGKDRDALRFLWMDNIQKDSPTVRKLRFTRVVFRVSASPFLLNARLNLGPENNLSFKETPSDRGDAS